MPGVEDLVDVLVALAVAGLGEVRVRELVDERELGRAADHGVDVHLGAAPCPPTVPRRCGTDLEPDGERGRLGPVVRLEVADHDVDPLVARLPALLEHPVGLPDPGGHPEQDPVAATHRCPSCARTGCGRAGRSA